MYVHVLHLLDPPDGDAGNTFSKFGTEDLRGRYQDAGSI
jgi:hypothetical protein